MTAERYPYEILIVDDDLVLQELLGQFLLQEGFHVHHATDTQCASQLLATHQPDMVILDVLIPTQNGLQWLETTKISYPHLVVIILSSQADYQDRIRGLELGANDYLTKPFHPKELFIRINNLLRSNTPQPHRTNVVIGEWLFDPEQELLQDHNLVLPPVKLTTAETRLLLFFCQNVGKVLTRDAISQHLHGTDANPLDRRIDMQVTRLRKKLEDNVSTGETKHLHTVWRQGYRFTL